MDTALKPLYVHDCDACIFLGTYTDSQAAHHDLYTCPDEGLAKYGKHTCCLARFGNEGWEYASMTLSNEKWAESLAAISGPRQSMYHCYIPELCEAWRRHSEKK